MPTSSPTPTKRQQTPAGEKFLTMGSIEIPFLLSATMHYYWKSCCKNSISTQKVLNINIHWCFFVSSYHGKCVVDNVSWHVSFIILHVCVLSSIV